MILSKKMTETTAEVNLLTSYLCAQSRQVIDYYKAFFHVDKSDTQNLKYGTLMTL